MKFDDRVSKYEYKLNETDELIVDFIKKHKDNIQNLSIKEVANSLFIAPNAIMRFCHKLDYRGFSELKVLINLDQNSLVGIPYNIRKSLELIDDDLLHIIASKIKNSKNVYFFGVGESSYYANMMCNNLRVLEKRAETYNLYHDIEYRINLCKENDLIFFITAKGNNERMIEFAKKAKYKGAKIVVVTHFDDNPMVEYADYKLFYCGEERKVSGYDVGDRTGMMIVLRALSEVFWRSYWA